MNRIVCVGISAVSASLGLVIGLTWPHSSSGQSTSVAADARLSRIEEQLNHLMEVLPLRGAVPSAVATGETIPDRTPIEGNQGTTPPDMKTVNDLKEIQILVTELLVKCRKESVSLHDEAVRLNGPKWDSIDAFTSGSDSDGWDEKARLALLLMTPSEVLARFGTPTGVTQSGWNWYRDYEGLAKGQVREFVIDFAGGVAHDADVARQ